MEITLSPVRNDDPLEVYRAGDTLTLNGVAFDFSALPDGATLPREAIESDWFAGPVERSGGGLHVRLVLPHGANAPQDTLFPHRLTLTGDGPVDLPPYEIEKDEA